MPASPFLQKFGRDILYLSAISGILGWSLVERAHQVAINQLLFKDMKTIGEITDRYAESIYYQIEQNTADYESEKDIHFRKKAHQARKLVGSFKEKVFKVIMDTEYKDLHKWLQTPKDIDKFERPASGSELEDLKLAAQNLSDSLVLIAESEEIATLMIKHFMGQDSATEFWSLAKKSKSDLSGVLLKDLMLKTDLAYITLLNFLSEKTTVPRGCFTFYPIVSAANSAIFPGQTYHAEVFLSQYSDSKMYERNTTIKVNGKSFPIKNGLVHFSQ